MVKATAKRCGAAGEGASKRARPQTDSRSMGEKVERFMVDKVYGRMDPQVIGTSRVDGLLLRETVELNMSQGVLSKSVVQNILNIFGALGNIFEHVDVEDLKGPPSESFITALDRATAANNKLRSVDLLIVHVQHATLLEPKEVHAILHAIYTNKSLSKAIKDTVYLALLEHLTKHKAGADAKHQTILIAAMPVFDAVLMLHFGRLSGKGYSWSKWLLLYKPLAEFVMPGPATDY